MNTQEENTKTEAKLPVTKREEDILSRLAKGMTNKEISAELNLSSATVRNHLSTIFVKLKVKNRAQAAVEAIKAGLIKMD